MVQEDLAIVRQHGMETTTDLEYSECNSRRTWNSIVGTRFTHLFYFYNTNDVSYPRLLFRLLLSESTSMESESLVRLSPTETFSGTRGGLAHALILESSPPVNKMLF